MNPDNSQCLVSNYKVSIASQAESFLFATCHKLKHEKGDKRETEPTTLEGYSMIASGTPTTGDG